jgi:hypothetical protein
VLQKTFKTKLFSVWQKFEKKKQKKKKKITVKTEQKSCLTSHVQFALLLKCVEKQQFCILFYYFFLFFLLVFSLKIFLQNNSLFFQNAFCK